MPGTLTRPEATTVRAQLSRAGRDDDLSGWARNILDEICSGSRVPPAIRHPLGFICVQLFRSIGWGLCMHIWRSPEASATLTTSPVHSHSWNLSSQVICGRLENIEIRVTDEVSKPTHRVLEITSADGRDFIRPTNRLVCCASTASADIEAGQNYILPAGIFHVSRPGASGPTVTVLLAEDRYKAPELALGRLDSSDHEVIRRTCPTRDLRTIAGITLGDLDARTHGGMGQFNETR